MTNPKNDEQQADEQAWQDNALESSQAEGLSGLDDEWSAALAEQAQGEMEQAKQAQAEQAQAEAAQPGQVFQPLDQPGPAGQGDVDMIMDIPVQLSVELGRTRLTIKNILQLGQGSVVELDGLAGEPMDIFVNGYLIAQGEVVVVDDKYGIRITDIITPSDRIHRLNTRR